MGKHFYNYWIRNNQNRNNQNRNNQNSKKKKTVSKKENNINIFSYSQKNKETMENNQQLEKSLERNTFCECRYVGTHVSAFALIEKATQKLIGGVRTSIADILSQYPTEKTVFEGEYEIVAVTTCGHQTVCPLGGIRAERVHVDGRVPDEVQSEASTGVFKFRGREGETVYTFLKDGLAHSEFDTSTASNYLPTEITVNNSGKIIREMYARHDSVFCTNVTCNVEYTI
jgi:hypothetical protein